MEKPDVVYLEFDLDILNMLNQKRVMKRDLLSSGIKHPRKESEEYRDLSDRLDQKIIEKHGDGLYKFPYSLVIYNDMKLSRAAKEFEKYYSSYAERKIKVILKN